MNWSSAEKIRQAEHPISFSQLSIETSYYRIEWHYFVRNILTDPVSEKQSN